MKSIFNKYKSHIYALLVLTIISVVFVPDSFQGKQISQSDITQYKGAATEHYKYSKNDELILWTNSQFGGMPTYMISGVSNQVLLKVLRIPQQPRPWATIFLYLICGYVMFIAFGARPWVAVIGAIGLGFATENLIILTVGHNTKALAIAYLPVILAGANYLFKKRYILGFNLIAIGMGLQVLVNHLQITYYTGILVGLFFLFQLIKHIKEKRIKDFGLASVLALLGVGLALGANSLPLLLTNEYAKHTIRAKSELTLTKENGKIAKAEKVSSGLTPSYAFSYSTGWTDIMATIIPNYSGGDSDRLGLYYGDIGSTSGPKYMGAAFFLLMIIGFVLYNGIEKWWLLTGLVVAIVLSMGGNHFTGINNFLFDNLPLYNKFRAPSIIMAIMQVCVGLMAILGLEQILQAKNDEATTKKIKYAGFGALGFIIILTFFSGIFNDFNSNPKYDEVTGQVAFDSDTRYAQVSLQRSGQQVTQQGIDRVKEMLSEQRIEEMKKDGFRSIFFAGAVFLLLWFTYKRKVELKWAILGVGLLVLADMWFVGKRYMSSDDFKSKRVVENTVPPNSADLAIQQDKGTYNVLDLTVNPLASTRTSYFHKSLGGYNAAKLRRYQETWDWYLIDDLRNGKVMGNSILNMLNTKYIIFPNRQQQNAEPQYTINPESNGNAWFVSKVVEVANADSAIKSLENLNTKTTATVESKFGIQTSTFSSDSSATIEITSYHPEHMVYESNNSADGFAVFSEIYYSDGWKAYINNQPVDHVCVNYILRGLKLPKGKNKVEFKFEPDTYATGKMISNISSGAILLLLVLSLGFWIRKKLQEDTE